MICYSVCLVAFLIRICLLYTSKASVVGAITQTTGKVLERAAGVSDIGAALTGNLPGVVTTQGAAGSYYIENLTVAIAKQAWELFLAVEEDGGFYASAHRPTSCLASLAKRMPPSGSQP